MACLKQERAGKAPLDGCYFPLESEPRPFEVLKEMNRSLLTLEIFNFHFDSSCNLLIYNIEYSVQGLQHLHSPLDFRLSSLSMT